MNVLKTKKFSSAEDFYKVDIGSADGDGEPFCSVKLLPYEGLLFSSSLEWLDYVGFLEDGDATHTVPRETIDQILQWVIAEGYTWKSLNEEPQS